MRNLVLITVLIIFASSTNLVSGFDGLYNSLDTLHLLSNAKTRSISPENFTGEKSKGGMAKLGEGSASNAAKDLGQGWKVNPKVRIEPNQTFVMGQIKGSGAIQHIWMTPTGDNCLNIIRIYWDDEKEPSIECPVGYFFATGLGGYMTFSSMPVCVNPGNGFNCYWTMPFHKSAKITMTNIDTKKMTLYYQIDYVLADVPKDAAYLHAQFRRVSSVPFKEVYTIVDGIKGQGQYVGTYMCWLAKNKGWWGEGEIKFYMDGDKEFPTICGTGTEDYFCGSYGFEGPMADDKNKKEYKTFCTPYAGVNQIVCPDANSPATAKIPGIKFSMYRWHITDPIRFEKDLKVTMQALGWQKGHKYLPLQDDISSVAFWYQTEPHNSFPQNK